MFRKIRTVSRQLAWSLFGLTVLGTVSFLTACSSKVEDLQSAATAATEEEHLLLASSLPPVSQSDNRGSAALGAARLGNLLVNITEQSNGSGEVDADDSLETIIEYDDDGQFVVPPGAANWDTMIVIHTTALQVGNLALVDYQFVPSGMQFAPAARLVIPGRLLANAKGIIPDEIYWLYWEPASGRWLVQDEIEVADDGNFYVEVDHFSKYRGLSQGGQ